MTASREDSTVCPQHNTAPSPQDMWPQTRACSKDVAEALPTLTKNRWCFHVKELLRFLLKTKAPLLAPCWDRAGICAAPQTHVHVTTSLDKTSPALTASSQRGCRTAACSRHVEHTPRSRLPCPALS